MAKKKDLIYNIGGDVSGLRAALSRGTVSLGKFAAAGTTALAGVGAAMVAVSVKNAAAFEQNIASAAAKTGDFENAMRAFEKAAVDAGLTSAFSATQAAEALGLLAQSGLDIAESTAAVPDLLNLAAAGALDLAEATDIATGVVQGFGLSVSELARVNDVLAKTANSSSQDVSMLGEAMSYAAPVASGLGVSLEETAAVLARLADANIKASRGGTSLNGILANMSKASAALGGSLKTSDIAALGFAGAMDQLQREGLDATNAMDLFGSRAGPAMLALLKVGTDGIREMDQALQDAGGTADLVARQQLNTLTGAITVLQGMIETMSIKLGQVFLPVLTLTATKMQDLASDALDANGDLSTLDKTLADFADTLSGWSSDVASAAGTLAVFAGVAVDTLTVISAGTRALGSVLVGSAATVTVMASGDDASATARAALDDFDQAVSDLLGVGSGTRAGIEIQNKINQMGKDVADAFKEAAEDIREGQKSISDILGTPSGESDALAGLNRQLDQIFSRAAKSVKSGAKEIDEELQYLTSIADRWMSQTATDTERYQDELWDLSDALERGLIDEETFARASAQLDEMYDPTGAHEWQRNILALADGAEKVKAELLGIDLATRAHLNTLEEMHREGLLTWDEYALAVDRASASVQGVSAEMELLMGATELLGSTLIDAIVDPFNTSIEEMVGNFSQALARMALEAAAQQAIMALFGGAAGGGAGAIGAIAGFADGGPVSGPGTSTSDSIVARLSDGEFVMPARAVRHYGVGMMERIRTGRLPKFADGGLVGGGSSGGGGGMTIVNVMDQSMVGDYLASSAGEKIVMNTISKNARLLKGALNGA